MNLNQIILDKPIIRALKSILPKNASRYAIDLVYVDKDKEEIVATDGRQLLLIKRDDTQPGHLIRNGELRTGLYTIVGTDTLCQQDNDSIFPDYHPVIPSTAKFICKNNDFLDGIIQCIATAQVGIKVFAFAKTLKALNALGATWKFFNDSPDKPVLMTATQSGCIIQSVIMPFTI